MAEELFEAIYTRYIAGGVFYTATGGRLAAAKAQESWTDNFAVIDAGSLDPDNCFRTPIDDAEFQINVFSTVRETCFDLCTAAAAFLNGVTLTPSGYHGTRIARGHVVQPVWNEQDKLYQATVEFRCKLQPT